MGTITIKSNLIASGQTTIRQGVQPHPSADNWIKALLSKALSIRTRSSFSHHQSLPSRSLHKPFSLIHQRANRRNKKHNLRAAKTKTILQKVNHDEKQTVRSQMKVKVSQLCPTICNPMDYIVHGILQA